MNIIAESIANYGIYYIANNTLYLFNRIVEYTSPTPPQRAKWISLSEIDETPSPLHNRELFGITIKSLELADFLRMRLLSIRHLQEIERLYKDKYRLTLFASEILQLSKYSALKIKIKSMSSGSAPKKISLRDFTNFLDTPINRKLADRIIFLDLNIIYRRKLNLTMNIDASIVPPSFRSFELKLNPKEFFKEPYLIRNDMIAEDEDIPDIEKLINLVTKNIEKIYLPIIYYRDNDGPIMTISKKFKKLTSFNCELIIKTTIVLSEKLDKLKIIQCHTDLHGRIIIPKSLKKNLDTVNVHEMSSGSMREDDKQAIKELQQEIQKRKDAAKSQG